MKTRVYKFKAKGFYCLSGNSSANSLFFEDQSDQQLFFDLLERFLSKVIDLHFYSTNATGWTLCFRTKKDTQIRQAFFDLKQTSNQDLSKYQDMSTGAMLSEHFRYFLSAYVKQSNFRHGRHGVRVHSKMEKYIFETEEDFEVEISKMKVMKETKVQKPKYRPNMRYYLVELQLNRKSVWRHSFVGINGEKLIQVVIPCFKYVLEKSQVLRELIIYTYKLHFGPNTNPLPPPQLE